MGGLAFWANDVFFNIGLYLDAIILAALAGTAAVGIYRPATQMLGAAMFLTGIIGPATLPMLSRLGIDGSADFKRAGGKTLSVFIVCAVPLTIGLVTFAGPLVLTVFGTAYQPSVAVLMAISLCIPPMFLNFQFSQLLTASDRQWLWTVALGGTCVVNPLFNFALIPLAQHYWHNAALGAALAWVATELAEVIYGTIILRDVVLDRSVGRALFGALTAGAAQCAMLWITAALWPPLAEALGVAAYGAVALALQALPREDVWLLFETVLFRVRCRRADPQAAVTSS
jgi:O-antigen/teichoic acid export membrane protein